MVSSIVKAVLRLAGCALKSLYLSSLLRYLCFFPVDENNVSNNGAQELLNVMKENVSLSVIDLRISQMCENEVDSTRVSLDMMKQIDVMLHGRGQHPAPIYPGSHTQSNMGDVGE